jgi:hypothetical protein
MFSEFKGLNVPGTGRRRRGIQNDLDSSGQSSGIAHNDIAGTTLDFNDLQAPITSNLKHLVLD